MSEPIVIERQLEVSLDDAFALVTQPERLRRWEAISAAVDLRVGGDYRFTMGPGHVAAGTFTEIVPGKRVVFTWGWAGSSELPPGASTVQIDLEPAAGGTLVRLTHSGLDAAAAASHNEGWAITMDRLVEHARTGDVAFHPFAGPPDTLDHLTSAEASWAICQHVMRAFTTADRERPTPCADYTVHELVDHLVGSVTALGGIAGGVFPDGFEPTSAEDHVAQAVEITLAAWRERGVGGEVPFGPGTAPAAVPAGILSLEFLVHASDFAAATGQQVDVPDHLAQYVLGIATAVIQPDNRGEGRGFAAEVDTDSTDPMEQLLAFTGRNP